MKISEDNRLNNNQVKDTTSSNNLSEEALWKKPKEELIQAIKQLILQREQHKGVIQYQKEKNNHLINQVFELKQKQKEIILEDPSEEEGALLPLLEALEEIPRKKERSKVGQALRDAFLNKNSPFYQPVNNFLVGLIFFSVICVTLESVPSFMDKWGLFFHLSEMIVVGLFTIEYIINIYVSDNKLKYIFGIWGLIDLLAILPSYFHLMDLRDIKLARTLRIVRFLRTIRMLRILKLTKNTADKYALARKRVETFKIDLQIYATTLFTVVTIVSTLVYYAERNIPDTSFTSIPSAMWWCVVTITTVGYGDMHPATFIGKLIAAVAMIIGLALFGLLMHVIGKAMMNSLFGTNKLP